MCVRESMMPTPQPSRDLHSTIACQQDVCNIVCPHAHSLPHLPGVAVRNSRELVRVRTHGLGHAVAAMGARCRHVGARPARNAAQPKVLVGGGWCSEVLNRNERHVDVLHVQCLCRRDARECGLCSARNGGARVHPLSFSVDCVRTHLKTAADAIGAECCQHAPRRVRCSAVRALHHARVEHQSSSA